MGTVTRIGRGPAGLPFSRMTLKDGRFFLSGQVAQNPETGRIDHPGCYEQSLTVLGNIRGILAEAGFAPEQVAKMTVFLTDMGQKDAFDRAFERVFRRVPEEGDAPGSPEGPGTGEGGAGLRFRTPPPWLKWNLKVLPDDGRSWQLPPPERIRLPARSGFFGTAAGGPPDLQCASFRRLWRAFFRASLVRGRLPAEAASGRDAPWAGFPPVPRMKAVPARRFPSKPT